MTERIVTLPIVQSNMNYESGTANISRYLIFDCCCLVSGSVSKRLKVRFVFVVSSQYPGHASELSVTLGQESSREDYIPPTPQLICLQSQLFNKINFNTKYSVEYS